MKKIALVLFAVAALEVVALGGEAEEKRVAEWVRRLKSDPPARNRRLIREIYDEATAGAKGHPPKASSTRKDLVPVLEAGTASDDREIRETAILGLCYMKCRDALPALERALDSSHSTVRYYAVMGIEWLADFADLRSSATAALLKARDREGQTARVKLHAATSLHELGVEQDPQYFIDRLRDPKANACLPAKVLADMGRKETVALMIARLRQEEPDGDHWMGVALEKLTGAKHGKNADAWQKWLDEHAAELPEQLK